MNEYDSQRILSLAEKVGYDKTDNINILDCYVLNKGYIEAVNHFTNNLKN